MSGINKDKLDEFTYVFKFIALLVFSLVLGAILAPLAPVLFIGWLYDKPWASCADEPGSWKELLKFGALFAAYMWFIVGVIILSCVALGA